MSELSTRPAQGTLWIWMCFGPPGHHIHIILCFDTRFLTTIQPPTALHKFLFDFHYNVIHQKIPHVEKVPTALSDSSSDTEHHSLCNDGAAGVVDWCCIGQLCSATVQTKVAVMLRDVDEDAQSPRSRYLEVRGDWICCSVRLAEMLWQWFCHMKAADSRAKCCQHDQEDQTQREKSGRWDGKRDGTADGWHCCSSTAPLCYHCIFNAYYGFITALLLVHIYTKCCCILLIPIIGFKTTIFKYLIPKYLDKPGSEALFFMLNI